MTALQSALEELGYLEEEDVDGKFGAKTEEALKLFQKHNGLAQTGSPARTFSSSFMRTPPRIPAAIASMCARYRLWRAQ